VVTTPERAYVSVAWGVGGRVQPGGQAGCEQGEDDPDARADPDPDAPDGAQGQVCAEAIVSLPGPAFPS
jgi:hypothetical protein